MTDGRHGISAVQAAAWAALNGVGLALVMPCVQAILAEVYYARQRGRAFGLLFTISALGGMFFNFIAVTFGDRPINGLPVRFPRYTCEGVFKKTGAHFLFPR